MPDGLYDQPLAVHLMSTGPDGGATVAVDLVGTSAGPAGSSLLDLPDGITWEVDHAQPEQLVGFGVEEWDADPSSVQAELLGALIGTRRSRQIGRWAASDAERAHRLGGPQQRGSRGTQPPRNGRFASASGRWVVAADLAADTGLSPLARVAAAAEWWEEVRYGWQGADLLRAGRYEISAALASSAEQVDDETIDGLAANDLLALRRLADLLREVADGDARAERLLERLDARSGPHDMVADGMRPLAVAAGGGAEFAAASAAPPAPAPMQQRRAMLGDASDRLDVTLHRPGLLHVRTARSDDRRWVRVLRREGLVTLAVAPFHRDELMELAELLVPPDIGPDDVVVELVHEPVALPTGASLVRDAVRCGRDATMLSRLGRYDRSGSAWRDCADLWEEAGDPSRAAIARRYASEGADSGPAFLADRVTAALGEV